MIKFQVTEPGTTTLFNDYYYISNLWALSEYKKKYFENLKRLALNTRSRLLYNAFMQSVRFSIRLKLKTVKWLRQVNRLNTKTVNYCLETKNSNLTFKCWTAVWSKFQFKISFNVSWVRSNFWSIPVCFQFSARIRRKSPTYHFKQLVKPLFNVKLWMVRNISY